MITEFQVEKQIDSVQSKPTLSLGINMDKLIGVPHLFCKYCDTRAGFMVVPIGLMTLQADGRITGYNHPNESYWLPYEYGVVELDQGFTFVGASNRFIPSSSWQQTYQGMPIGFYCSEPESPQKLCLIPHTNTNTKNLEIVYVIASCQRFYQKTVPTLLKELLAEGIAPSKIKVVVNGCDQDDDEIINGVSYAFSKHNAWELSALYEAPLRWQFDYAMLIHDTNQVYPGFKRKVENFNQHLKWDHLPATPLARCLLGLYAHDFLMKTNPWLKKIDGMDKAGGIIAEVAGELLHRANAVLAMSDPESNEAAKPTEWRETADFFNSGTLRIRRVFPTLNLHKFTHTGVGDALSL